MIFYIDSNEAKNHPEVINELKERGHEVIIEHLQCGDFTNKTNVLIEHKDLDLVSSIKSDLIWKQCSDMIYNTGFVTYVLITLNLSDFNKYNNLRIHPHAIVSTWASLNQNYNIHCSFIGGFYEYIDAIEAIFTKALDTEVHTVNPVRREVTIKDRIVNGYLEIPSVDKVLSERLYEKFPIPRTLYNSTIDELMKVEGIGVKTAHTIYTYINGVS